MKYEEGGSELVILVLTHDSSERIFGFILHFLLIKIFFKLPEKPAHCFVFLILYLFSKVALNLLF